MRLGVNRPSHQTSHSENRRRVPKFGCSGRASRSLLSKCLQVCATYSTSHQSHSFSKLSKATVPLTFSAADSLTLSGACPGGCRATIQVNNGRQGFRDKIYVTTITKSTFSFT